jgi:hypothetical protein
VSRAELTWYRLSFPRDLTATATLAALASFSGLPHGSSVVLSLSATNTGITHHLAVRSRLADSVLGALRAAMPSLRVDVAEPPTPDYCSHTLWQVAPATGALRTDEPGAITASLLASLFPLRKDESVQLVWTLSPMVRPPLRDSEDKQQGRTRALQAKLGTPGLGATGELYVHTANRHRTGQLVHRVGAVLRSLSTPHGRLLADGYWWGQVLRLLGQRGRYFSVTELATVIGWPIDGPDLPGLELGAAKRLVPSASLPTAGRLLGTTDFAGITQPVALSPAASTRGLYVLGPTGTGKTSLIKNLIADDLEAGRGLAVVETNGDLINDLVSRIPSQRVSDVVLLDPTDPDFAVGFNPFAGSSDPSLVADQLGELFYRLWKDSWGPRTAQLAHMGLLTLARRQGSTLLDLPRLYLDPSFRTEVLADLDDPVGLEPDWRWFARLPEREQATVVAPLLNKVRQFTARPSIRAIMGQAAPPLSIQRLMSEQKILLVHLPKGLIGNDTATLLGCLILTAIWQAAAERTALPTAQRRPFGLYVDEVQDFAAAPIPWAEMFAQGRKYGLALTVAHQNLAQLPKELREVVLANARSRAVFALSAHDAKALESLFAPALTAADLQSLDAYSVAAHVALDDGSTARPVTLVTPPPPPSLGSAAPVRRQSRARYARARSEVEAELRRKVAGPPPTHPVGRKRRPRR